MEVYLYKLSINRSDGCSKICSENPLEKSILKVPQHLMFGLATFGALSGSICLFNRGLFTEHGRESLLGSVAHVTIKHATVDHKEEEQLDNDDHEHDDVGFRFHPSGVVAVQKDGPKEPPRSQHRDVPVKRWYHAEQSRYEIQHQ